MRALAARLKRMERALEPMREDDQPSEQHIRVMTRLAIIGVQLNPGIEFVERADCPSEYAWLQIQSELAWARGDVREACRLDDQQREQEPFDFPAGDMAAWMNAMAQFVMKDDSTEVAIRNARRRLGLPGAEPEIAR